MLAAILISHHNLAFFLATMKNGAPKLSLMIKITPAI